MKKRNTEAVFRMTARGFEVNGKRTVTKRLSVDRERDQMRLAIKAWVKPTQQAAVEVEEEVAA